MKDRKDELLWSQDIIRTKKAWYYIEARIISIIVEPPTRKTVFKIGTKRLMRLLRMQESQKHQKPTPPAKERG